MIVVDLNIASTLFALATRVESELDGWMGPLPGEAIPKFTTYLP